MQILVIDDDETFCRLLVEILDERGISAKWTTNGLTGYEMLANEEYDLCIIDVRMPLVLGTELAEALKQDYPRVKIILTSAFADQALQDYARRIGLLLLSKPFSPRHLLDTVERALGAPLGRT
ncbi:MAG TPA: response regulator [Methylomirabilota bacterium]|nr:response regulator [Methylomirabilota bacterium]